MTPGSIREYAEAIKKSYLAASQIESERLNLVQSRREVAAALGRLWTLREQAWPSGRPTNPAKRGTTTTTAVFGNR